MSLEQLRYDFLERHKDAHWLEMDAETGYGAEMSVPLSTATVRKG